MLKKTDFRVNQLKNRNATVPIVFQEIVAKNPNKVVLMNSHGQWTLKELDDFSNRVAAYFTQHGFKHGDEVALFMNNCPEYIGIWLGLAKAGCVTALINTNQRMKTLAHSVNTVNAKAVIFGNGFADGMYRLIRMQCSNANRSCVWTAIQQAKPLLAERQVKYFYFGDDKDAPRQTPNMRLDMNKLSADFKLVKGGFNGMESCVIMFNLLHWLALEVTTVVVSNRSASLHLHVWHDWLAEGCCNQTLEIFRNRGRCPQHNASAT